MKILIAEDDPVSLHILSAMLGEWGYEVLPATDGQQALEVLRRDRPSMAVIDWMMPGLEGVEVCRRARELAGGRPPYLILLTSRETSEDIATGLDAGADDYITKPFSRVALAARLRVGERVVQLQSTLADRVQELERALENVKTLQGILPICSYCKRIRTDQDYWLQLERYISEHSDALFTHGICPDCFQKYVEPELQKRERQIKARRRSAAG